MIERAIEDWLTKAYERDYLLSFCQVLIHKGHRILYISSHSQLEQGKDIITIDADGNCCAYQLKAGQIDIQEWRKIRGEVKELIELPVVHPSVDRSKIHKSYLVTNGDFTDPVRLQIAQINEDNKIKKRNYSYLDTLNGKTLLKDFIDAQGEFLPRGIEQFESFLDFFRYDGRDFFPKNKYFNFINRAIFSKAGKVRTRQISAITSSIIITAYLLKQFQLRRNYYAQFEAWIALATSQLRFATSLKMDHNLWQPSYQIVMEEARRNLSTLKDELFTRDDFLEGNWIGDGGDLYRTRVTLVLGAIAALESWFHRNGSKPKDKMLLEIIRTNIRKMFFWGESAFPFIYHIVKYLELVEEQRLANQLLILTLDYILNLNHPHSVSGLASPYYSPSDVLESKFGITLDDIDFGDFPGSSYILESIILMLTRRNMRDVVASRWRTISHMMLEGFKLDRIEDTFTWKTEDGENAVYNPKATKSWRELKLEATDITICPELYKQNLDLLHFFVLVCPHRASSTVVSLLDTETPATHRQ